MSHEMNTGHVCPRCGEHEVNDSVLDPLSRHRNQRICRHCAYDEAIRDMRGTPLPFHDWHDVKAALASGQRVYEVTVTQTASVLVVAEDEDAAMSAADETPDEYYRQHTPWTVTDCAVVLPDDD